MAILTNLFSLLRRPFLEVKWESVKLEDPLHWVQYSAGIQGKGLLKYLIFAARNVR
jgi:hypothetical protein